MTNLYAERILHSRRNLGEAPDNHQLACLPDQYNNQAASRQAIINRKPDEAAEGGCGVLGFAANIPVAGRHVLAASRQMHNRGNGKGGGIAMVGLDPGQVGVNSETLSSHYLLQIALLDPDARQQVEQDYILPCFDLAQAFALEHLEDYRQLEGLEVRPPDVWRYFVRVKPQMLDRFAEEKDLLDLPQRLLEDEFIYQNSYKLNQQFYASLGEKRAFVLSHGRDLSVLKIVGYAENVVQYYCLEDQRAHVWIAHQRYPTKGRVWHPGGAHPFIGLNEALVHNGDFANYHAVSEYLRQRNIGQLFLTDTEVSVQLFDLWDRVYGYPLEITLEAMAPTTEHDFVMLPDEKRQLYQAVQRAHLHGSPDGPWFFIVARSHPDEGRYELLGITDTSMLRPQVFALYENSSALPSPSPLAPLPLSAGEGSKIYRPQGDRQGVGVERIGQGSEWEAGDMPLPGVQIGLIASERQAINACLRSLSGEDERFQPVADRYWVARGGSHTDGGAFRFTYSPGEGLLCANKFGIPVELETGREHVKHSQVQPQQASPSFRQELQAQAWHAFDNGRAPSFWRWLKPAMPSASWDELAWMLDWMDDFARNGDEEWRFVSDVFTLLHDRRYDTGAKKRASLLGMVDRSLMGLFDQAPSFDRSQNVQGGPAAARLTWETRHDLRPPHSGETTLLLDTLDFPPEGDESAARWLVQAQQMGWRHMVAYNWRGGRFAACGFGPDSQGTRVDLYGDVGDYAGSGLDGAEVHLHGDGQDQMGQILKRGKLVVHGDVGQTFLYGAKGGEIYVLGSAAGRPLINAVGRPRAVINGTCLDYLAESFMAGDPLHGGGFVILNGVAFDESGRLKDLPTPYPGGNLFSLASGGAIYLRDPYLRVDEDQLNGGTFAELGEEDWTLIEPYLRENERLFEIAVDDLLKVDGRLRSPSRIYRKVEVRSAGILKDTGLAAETENR